LTTRKSQLKLYLGHQPAPLCFSRYISFSKGQMMSMQFNPINPNAPFLWHGGDYNPEQWPPEIWQDD